MHCAASASSAVGSLADRVLPWVVSSAEALSGCREGSLDSTSPLMAMCRGGRFVRVGGRGRAACSFLMAPASVLDLDDLVAGPVGCAVPRPPPRTLERTRPGAAPREALRGTWVGGEALRKVLAGAAGAPRVFFLGRDPNAISRPREGGEEVLDGLALRSCFVSGFSACDCA